VMREGSCLGVRPSGDQTGRWAVMAESKSSADALKFGNPTNPRTLVLEARAPGGIGGSPAAGVGSAQGREQSATEASPRDQTRKQDQDVAG
jgi:hypothetical protein